MLVQDPDRRPAAEPRVTQPRLWALPRVCSLLLVLVLSLVACGQDEPAPTGVSTSALLLSPRDSLILLRFVQDPLIAGLVESLHGPGAIARVDPTGAPGIDKQMVLDRLLELVRSGRGSSGAAATSVAPTPEALESQLLQDALSLVVDDAIYLLTADTLTAP